MKNTRAYLVASIIITIAVLLAGTVCTNATETPLPPTPTSTPASSGPTPTPLLVVVTPTPGGPTPTAGAPQILKLGNFGMTSGAGSAYGLASMRSAQEACEDINLAGGVVVGGQRYMFQPITVEAGYSVDTGRTAGERLVYAEGCKYVVGVGTADGLGVQEVTEKNKVLLFVETWSNPIVASDKIYTFRDMMGADGQYKSIYSYMKAKFPDKNKVYYQSTEGVTYRQGYDASIPAMEKMGYQSVGIDYADPATTDWYPVVTKMKAAKADFVDLYMSGTYVGALLKAADELGLKKQSQLIWTIGDGVQNVLKVAGKQATEGVFFTQEWDWYGKYVSDTGKAFAKRYKDRFGDEQTIHGFLTYDMVFGLVQAMQQTNSIDPTVLKDAIPNLTWASPSMGKDTTLRFVDVGGRKAGMEYSEILGQYQDGKVVNMAIINPGKPPVTE